MVFTLLFFPIFLLSEVLLGVDVLFLDQAKCLWGKRIGLVTNHTGVNRDLHSTVDLFLEQKEHISLIAVFSPEHGFNGSHPAGEKIENFSKNSIKFFSLYGENRRPTEKMLENIDVLVYDIQEIGARPYTYATTLFYIMEEAAKKKVAVYVLDRPNPMGGVLVDGPMLQENMRSFLGYINIPYCHGMTIGELACYFNGEYKVGVDLKIISMKGWQRSMTYQDTKLYWIPTSPNIPEPDTPFYFASIGALGELNIVNIGVGYTLPFKVIGAPWICGKDLAKKLNEQHLPGVIFAPCSFRPFFGLYKGENCEGVRIIITHYLVYRPLVIQYYLLGMLKSLYPKEFMSRIQNVSAQKKDLFFKVTGNEEIYNFLINEKYIIWKLIEFQKDEREQFINKRQKYLLY